MKKLEHRLHLHRHQLTLGQKLADTITSFGGSWTFILMFLALLLVWMSLNTVFLIFGLFDPYPFILLNLVLSCLAAIQAPIILMSQNRAAQRDRAKAERDYMVNRKAEREVVNMQQDLEEIKVLIRDMHISRKNRKRR
ncbi:DUF1003 domain-containing protein [Candidatus Woesearchaeota archaeon]|nr:DUF1003 domain-containing protein [Candidatus Woesearchaeota archaeon]